MQEPRRVLRHMRITSLGLIRFTICQRLMGWQYTSASGQLVSRSSQRSRPHRRACHQAVCAAALSRRDTCVCAVRPRVHSLRCGCRQRRAVAASRGASITMSQPLVACRRLKSRGQRDAAGLLHLSTASAQGRGFFSCNKVHQPHLWMRLLSWKDDPLDLPRRQSQTGRWAANSCEGHAGCNGMTTCLNGAACPWQSCCEWPQHPDCQAQQSRRARLRCCPTTHGRRRCCRMMR